VVMLDRFPLPGYDTIIPSEKESCELVLRHLLDLGHHRILFVAQPKIFQPKIKAFEEVCSELGLGKGQVRSVMVEGLDNPVTDTVETLSKVYEECCPFTAVITASDHYALGCYNFFKSQGIKCPDDVSIVGADNLEFIENVELKLTTVWCEPSDVAKKVCEQVEYRLIQGNIRKTPGKEIEISPTMVLRESTARPLLKFGEPN